MRCECNAGWARTAVVGARESQLEKLAVRSDGKPRTMFSVSPMQLAVDSHVRCIRSWLACATAFRR